MAKEALELWQGLPADTRRMLLSNVWCGKCRKAVTIVDYHTELKGVVVLQGFCGTCGHKVARVIDDLGPATKKKIRAPASGLYIFDIRIYSRPVYDAGTDASRKIQIAGTKSLYNFARVITRAFDFEFDHCFGFYDNLQKYHDSKRSYELFVDIGEASSSSMVKGVKKTKIDRIFKNIGEKMLFLFDYGDGWYFTVELKEIKRAEKWDLKPVILESIGKAPLQYPPCEDEAEQSGS